MVKNANVFEDLRKEKDIPTLAFENALLPLYKSGEMPYHALGNLPELYIDRNEKLEVAKIMLQDTIRQYQDASIQHQYRLNHGDYQMYVSLFLFDLAKINMSKMNINQLYLMRQRLFKFYLAVTWKAISFPCYCNCVQKPIRKWRILIWPWPTMKNFTEVVPLSCRLAHFHSHSSFAFSGRKAD